MAKHADPTKAKCPICRRKLTPWKGDDLAGSFACENERCGVGAVYVVLGGDKVEDSVDALRKASGYALDDAEDLELVAAEGQAEAIISKLMRPDPNEHN